MFLSMQGIISIFSVKEKDGTQSVREGIPTETVGTREKTGQGACFRKTR